MGSASAVQSQPSIKPPRITENGCSFNCQSIVVFRCRQECVEIAPEGTILAEATRVSPRFIFRIAAVGD